MAHLRPATVDDRPRLRTIQTAALAEPWPALIDVAGGDGPTVLVIVTDEPVGYAVTLAGDGTAAYLPELAVHPEYQGRGLGSTLLHGLCRRLGAEGYERLRVTARATDDRVRSFYRNRGFREIARRTDHFETCDGLVLERRLE